MQKTKKKNHRIRFKVGDKVQVISGQEKGKISTIKQIFRRENSIIVEGINLKIKHFKPTNANETGEIKQIELPIHSSNIRKYQE
jgi:large subunit ribosomal protein L24